jgi:hypothetical protein
MLDAVVCRFDTLTAKPSASTIPEASSRSAISPVDFQRAWPGSM